jgi:hypothetical protein
MSEKAVSQQARFQGFTKDLPEHQVAGIGALKRQKEG